jgi:DNA segregation ATPase FtsK/SpoIIIE, S-DNA-T family
MRSREKESHAGKNSRRGNSEKRQVILAILLMACGVLIALAVVSHDVQDEANASLSTTDLFNTVSGTPDAHMRADTTHNWLGLLGAVMSDTLVNGTFGYASIVLPGLLMLWGWILLRRGDGRRGLVLTNILLSGMALAAASFGMLQLLFPESGPAKEWSGVVGHYLAVVLSRLLGLTGGTILLLVAILIALVVAIDLDVRSTLDRMRRVSLRFLDWMDRVRERWAGSQGARTKARVDDEDEEEDVPVRPRQTRAPVTIARPPVEEPENAVPITLTTGGKTPAVTIATKRPSVPERDEGEGVAETATETAESIPYVFPSTDLLDAPRPESEKLDEEELKANADLLRDTLAQFDVELESVSVTPGPVVTLYELVPASGVKISRIVSLENDMALKLAAKGIRILAPIPGRSAVGVEIPNHHRVLVTIRNLLHSATFRDASAPLPLALGKTISGEVFVDDLSKMPHVLIAGSTGSGKSVGINTIIASLLFKKHPSELKFVIIDPKKIELSQYSRLANHFLAISPDINETIVTTPGNAVIALKGVEFEMEKRYDRLSQAGARNIEAYNDKVKNGKVKNTDTVQHGLMPYLIVVIDELADLMITAAREVEEPIARLAQLARAVGIHLIVATQRPSVDVITGVIKANFPARVAYQVASKTDSRTILDMNGAEQLLGEGDMLYLPSGSPKPVRLQNPYISPDEVDALMDHIAGQQGFTHPFQLPSIAERRKADGAATDGERDELFEEAARLVVRHQQGSVSLLQRRLKVGYSRAARLVDELEAAGIVGPYDGSKAREVLVETDAELNGLLK